MGDVAISGGRRDQVKAKLISLQVGVPRIITRDADEIATGIYKDPVDTRVQLHWLNLDGDRQADLTVHGGKDKAVYVYPSEHYSFWKNELPGMDLPWGAFGENFTTLGLSEKEVCIGDHFTIGSAELAVTQPRLPCYKLGLKFNRDDMIKRFLASGRTGFYLRVLREGEVGPGDEIMPAHKDENRVSVSDILRLYLDKSDSSELLHRTLQVEYLSGGWREQLRQRI